jgi:hypothetical protein
MTRKRVATLARSTNARDSTRERIRLVLLVGNPPVVGGRISRRSSRVRRQIHGALAGLDILFASVGAEDLTAVIGHGARRPAGRLSRGEASQADGSTIRTARPAGDIAAFAAATNRLDGRARAKGSRQPGVRRRSSASGMVRSAGRLRRGPGAGQPNGGEACRQTAAVAHRL